MRRPLLGRCDLCRCKVWQGRDGDEQYRSGAPHHHRKAYVVQVDDPEPGPDRAWYWETPGFNPAWR